MRYRLKPRLSIPLMRRCRSSPSRFAVMIALVFVTQIAYAGDLCRSIMMGGMVGNGVQHAAIGVGDSRRVEMAMPCCAAWMLVEASRCISTSPDAATTTPTPSIDWHEPVGYIASVTVPCSRLQSRADHGRSPPPYMVFHRFLS